MLFSGLVQAHRCLRCNAIFSNVIPTSVIPIAIVVVASSMLWGGGCHSSSHRQPIDRLSAGDHYRNSILFHFSDGDTAMGDPENRQWDLPGMRR